MAGENRTFDDKGRVCNKCTKYKLYAEFYKDKTSSSGAGVQRACKICQRDKGPAKKREHNAVRVEVIRQWRARNPEKYRAQGLVSRALKKGTLVRQPCEKCGKSLRIEAHHDDYSKPLEIRWLCRWCHAEFHRIHGNEEIPYIDWKIRPRALPQQKFEDTSFNFGNEQA